MNYYRALFDEGFDAVICDSQAYDLFNEQWDGSSHIESWVPITVVRSKKDNESISNPADFPFFLSNALVCTERAVNALQTTIENSCEVLPLITPNGEILAVLNCNVVDALDTTKSSIHYFPNSEKIMAITHHALSEEKIQGLNIFRVRKRSGYTIVSEKFCAIYASSGLSGLTFSPGELA